MTQAEDMTFSLDRLERWTYTGKHEDAARMIVGLFRSFDSTYGHLGEIGSAPSDDFTAEQRDVHFATRIASAMTALFSSPQFQLSPGGFRELIKFQRWLATVFGASPFGNADHVIRVLNLSAETKPEELKIAENDLLKFCLLYSLDSRMPLQPAILWEKDRRLGASLCLALLSSRIAVTEEAHAKREILLEWFPPKIADLSLDEIPTEILHDVWMHCSYAARPDKHVIKRAINELLRQNLLNGGFRDIADEERPARDKPVVMVITEWFNSGHAVFRTHSTSIEALRKKYHVVGVCQRQEPDETVRAVFDEVHTTPKGAPNTEAVRAIYNLAQEIKPDMVYYTSVGMFLDTVILCNLRLAPIQMVTWGHSASTFSPVMDYYLVEEDLFGDANVFSEKVVALPNEALPYRPQTDVPKIEPTIRDAPDPVRIAVAASVMKLNPLFLKALKKIEQQAQSRIEYRFFTGHAIGLGKVYIQNLIHRFLPGSALVHPHLQYAPYLEKLNECDMFLNPFPFGNCNGIVDTVRQGLVGVCWSGPEIHSHIDEAYFGRLGLPEWLVTRSADEYVETAVRLIDDHKLRASLSRDVLKRNPDQIFTKGNPSLFLEAVDWIHHNHDKLMQSDEKLLKPPVSTRGKRQKAASAGGE